MPSALQFFYANAVGVTRLAPDCSATSASSAAAESEQSKDDDKEEIRSVMEPLGPEPKTNQAMASDQAAVKAEFEAAVRRLSDDVGAFYQQVQQWQAIPRAFERLVWESDAILKQPIERWILAELSRTVFGEEPPEMELVEYIMGLLDHPEFREPDLLVLELHEFLGKHVAVRTPCAHEGLGSCFSPTECVWWIVALCARVVEVPRD